MKPFRDRRKVFTLFKQDPQNKFKRYEKKYKIKDGTLF